MSYLSGQILTADELNSWLPVPAYLTSDQALNTSSTTLQNVTQLAIPVAANVTYRVDVNTMATLSAGTTEDIKIAVTFPTGAVCYVLVAMGGTAAGVTTFVASDLSIAAVSATGIASGSAYATYGLSTSVTGSQNPLLLVMGGTAGTLQVQAAQSTSGANTVTVKKGSLIVAQRVA